MTTLPRLASLGVAALTILGVAACSDDDGGTADLSYCEALALLADEGAEIGPDAARDAEAEWKRVHQGHEAPSDMPVVRVEAGPHKPHHLVVRAGLAKSNGEAVRLLRQRAVKRDGEVLAFGDDVVLVAGNGFVMKVGRRYARIEA